jgi:hypothetical protein
MEWAEYVLEVVRALEGYELGMRTLQKYGSD